MVGASQDPTKENFAGALYAFSCPFGTPPAVPSPAVQKVGENDGSAILAGVLVGALVFLALMTIGLVIFWRKTRARSYQKTVN